MNHFCVLIAVLVVSVQADFLSEELIKDLPDFSESAEPNPPNWPNSVHVFDPNSPSAQGIID